MLTRSPQEESLFAAVCAAPDDDAPRLAMADWLAQQDDDEAKAYAQYIRLALAIHADDHETPDFMRAREANALLTDAHKRSWSNGIADRIKTFNYRRGFVAMLRLRASEAVPQLSALVTACPLQHLDLVDDAKAVWSAFLGAPETAQLESLVLSGNRLDDADFAQLCDHANLPRLHWLELEKNPLTMASAERLARATARFPNLRTVIWPQAIESKLADDVEGGWAVGSIPITVDRPPEARTFRAQFGEPDWLSSGPRSASRWRRR